jgi:hypothetical protein
MRGDMLRATYRPLCCAENYVAHGFCGARDRAARVPNAPSPRVAIPIAHGRAQHISAGVAIATIALGLDHESLDSTDVHLEAATELKPCVHDRVGVIDREACQLPRPVAPLALVESFRSARNMLRRQARSPATGAYIDRGQHSCEGNIGREVPLNARVRQVLDEWLEHRATVAGAGEPGRCGFSRTGYRLPARSADRDVRMVAAGGA